MKFALVSKKSKTSSVNFFNYKTTVFVFKKYQNFIDFKFNFKPVIIRKFSSDLLGEKHFTTIIQQYLPNSFINFKKRILFDNCFVCFFVNSYSDSWRGELTRHSARLCWEDSLHHALTDHHYHSPRSSNFWRDSK